MWADTLLDIERAHVLRLLVWGGLSVAVAVLLLLLLRLRRIDLPLLRHFALQNLIWGGATLIIASVWLRTMELRDLAQATRLVNLLWLGTGLALGVTATGATLALSGWLMARRESAIGAGMAIVLHGLALIVLYGQTLTLVGRW